MIKRKVKNSQKLSRILVKMFTILIKNPQNQWKTPLHFKKQFYSWTLSYVLHSISSIDVNFIIIEKREKKYGNLWNTPKILIQGSTYFTCPIIGLKTINIIFIVQIGFRNYIKLLRGPINQHKLPRRAQKLQQCPNVLIQSPQN